MAIKTPKRDLTIERPRGMTYSRNTTWTVYEHSIYPRHSVLAGQPCRKFVDNFETIEEAKKAYPTAREIAGTTFQAPDLSHLSDGPDY
jgi:hypothetical protein